MANPGFDSGAALAPSDADIVRRVRGGESALFEVLMRRHNQRVYRAARAVVQDEDEAEEVMQQAYLNAYAHLDQFEERSQFSTWLVRIALNEAFARRRRRLAERQRQAGGAEPVGDIMEMLVSPHYDPERQAYAKQLHRVLEQAVDTLPDTYRAVFMLREIEGLSTSETAAGLGLGDEAVKTRLHRARAMIRRSVAERIGDAAAGAFEFHARRCDRVVAAVMARISSTDAVRPDGVA